MSAEHLDLSIARRFPYLCDSDVSRDGESQPCSKPAVAVHLGDEGDSPYAVCAFHTRVGAMVSLAELLGVVL